MPAPFAPTRPILPEGTSRLTSASATTSPKRCVSPEVTIRPDIQANLASWTARGNIRRPVPGTTPRRTSRVSKNGELASVPIRSKICIVTQTCNDQTEAGCCSSDRLQEVLHPEFFKALSDPNRILLLAKLSAGGEPSTVSEAADCCTVDLSVVSRHLATMRDAGVLTAEKRGREVFYSVPYAELAANLRSIADALEACCGPESTHDNERKTDV
ncbi:MAG TPA: ArsR family transcriptional regulator [Actinobacteria bacterium]|nr:ArsR family transcriptional regulator [Actinomycetota bacterium]